MEGKHIIMNAQQKGIIALVKSALTDSGYEIPDGFDLKAAADIAKEHQIATMLYYGAAKCGFSTDSNVMQQMFMSTCAHLAVSEDQIYEMNRIYKAFEETDIDYMPLKGAVLKCLYPKAEMRPMGDADILIRTQQYDKVKSVVESLGYIFKYESDHELVWGKENSLMLELHKSVMTSYNKDFYSYFGDGWKFAKQKCGNRFEMSDEDFYIYIFVHFTKHYRVSGIGIKHLIDLWVYKNAKPELNWAYILREFEKLHIKEFYTNVNDTLSVWFDDGEENVKTELITNSVFTSGAYGHSDIAEVSKFIRDSKETNSMQKARIKRILRAGFPSYSEMCKKFAFLKKAPFFLPVMWLVRCFDILLFKRKKVLSYMSGQRSITSDAIQQQKKKLREVGLDFYFEG